MVMNQTKEARNKALVLEAFDTLFNQRDYAAAEKYWSPDYIQHSAHIAQGRDGLFGDAALVERDQSLVGDRDPVSVARQISQHRFRSRKRALGVHHALTGSHRRKPLGEGCRIVERRVFAEEPQLTPARDLGKGKTTPENRLRAPLETVFQQPASRLGSN
jgi:hypothetical protein